MHQWLPDDGNLYLADSAMQNHAKWQKQARVQFVRRQAQQQLPHKVSLLSCTAEHAGLHTWKLQW